MKRRWIRPGRRLALDVSAVLVVFAVVACSAPAPPANPTTSAPAAAPAATTAPAQAAPKPTTAPAPAAASASPTLIIANDQSDVKTLDPAREFEFAAAFIDLNAYDTLITQKGPDELTSFVPVLAKEWKLS